MRLRTISASLSAAAVFAAVSSSAAIFEPLFVVTKIVGDATVTRPDGRTEALLVDHAYPYGSCVKVASALTSAQISAFKSAGADPEEPQVSFIMSPDYRFRLSAGSEAVIADTSEDGAERRQIDLRLGSLSTFITAASTKTGGSADSMVEANLAAVSVKTPVGQCSRLTQRNQISVERDAREPSVYHCSFASQSGVMELSGPQFKLSKLEKGTVVDIDGSADFTSISAKYGEFTAEIEKGAVAVEKARFRTRCIGKIWREYAEIGGRMAVSVMIYYPDGKLVSYNYLEGQTGVGLSSAESQSGRAVVADATSGSGEAAQEGDAFGFGSDQGDDSGSESESSASSSSGDSFDFGDW